MVDPITGFFEQVRTRLKGKRYIELVPVAPTQLAFLKGDWAGGRYVVAVFDARQSADPPATTFERTKAWFEVAINGREHGVLLFVYAPAVPATVEDIQKASWWAGSARVIGGAYDLSSAKHWLSAGGLENDIFD